MPPLSRVDIGQRKLVLQKGESGTGKTIGALSFATKEKQFYTFDVDQRMETVVTYFKRYKPELLEWNHYDTYRDWQSIIDKLDSWIKAKRCPYGGILLDSITTVCKMIFMEQIEDREDREELSKKNNQAEKVKVMRLGDIPVSQIEDYKAENAGVSIILSMLRSDVFKDVDIFVNAHVMVHYQKSIKDDAKGEAPKPTRRIVTAGQAIAAEIPIYFNEVWHYYQTVYPDGRPQYVVMFAPSQKVKTEFNDFSRTAYEGILPNELDWTGKILGDEFRKLIPAKGTGF